MDLTANINDNGLGLFDFAKSIVAQGKIALSVDKVRVGGDGFFG